ncbi:RimJ/RimL family protein N-acetyltransferase [Actinocorallia herbida]|uniref:RimJ/RimL family protein N-acetyltransferase n=1 Tax=Actinocorallia herbida TaxID=58109 RepID=A0A3N1D7A5_9ACTN|nr:GNAT family N-acetyltransferase [Actinocorallia herbida]ROO88998.1 RimJ/RimL family protein N-acetyltransferase [Actinocorallia herbida]
MGVDGSAGPADPPESLELGDAVLRRTREGDAAVLLDAVNASFAELHPWMPWAARPLTLDDEFEMIAAAQDNWRNGDAYLYGAFAPDGTALGGFGMHRRVGPGAIEIGYWLRTGHTGRGLATRAVRALTTAALALPDISRVEIHCDEANTASAAVPHRLGYHLAETRPTTPEAPAETGRTLIWTTAALPHGPPRGNTARR